MRGELSEVSKEERGCKCLGAGGGRGGRGGGCWQGGGSQGTGSTWDPKARQPSARATLCRGEAMAPVKPYSALAVSFKAFWRESRMAREPAKYHLACLELP